MNRFIALFLLATLAVCIESAVSESSPGKPVRLGVVLSLTGDFSFFGTEARRGAEIAEEAIRESGGQVELVFEDDKCLPKAAVDAYQRLRTSEQVDMIVGPGCTGAILSIAPAIVRDGKAMLALFDANKEVEKMGKSVFVIGYETEVEGAMMAEHVKKSGFTEVGVICEIDAWAEVIRKAFVARFEELGGKIVADELHDVSIKDYRPTITKVLGRNPKALFVVPAYSGGYFLKQLRVQAPTIPVFGPDTMGIKDVLDVAGKAAEGVTYANVALDESSPHAKKFKEAYHKKFGEDPTTFFYAAMGYDAVRMAHRAVATGADPATALQSVTLSDSPLGITGFNERRMSMIKLGVFQVRNGQFVLTQ